MEKRKTSSDESWSHFHQLPRPCCFSFDVYKGSCDCTGERWTCNKPGRQEREGRAWEPEKGGGRKQMLLGANNLGLGLPPVLFQVRFLVQKLAGNLTQLSLHLCLQHPSQNLAWYRCEINIWWTNAARSCSLFRWVVCKHFSLSCLPLLCKVLRERLGTCWGLFRIQTVLLLPVRTGRPPPHQDRGFLFSLEKEAQLA